MEKEKKGYSLKIMLILFHPVIDTLPHRVIKVTSVSLPYSDVVNLN